MVRIPKNHEIKIKVPQNVPPNEVAEVILIVRKRTDNFKQKINELKGVIFQIKVGHLDLSHLSNYA